MTKFGLFYSLPLGTLTQPLTLGEQDRSDIEAVEATQKVGERNKAKMLVAACSDEAAAIRRGAYHRAYPNAVEIIDDIERWKIWGYYLPQAWSPSADAAETQTFEMPDELKEKYPTYQATLAELQIRTRYYDPTEYALFGKVPQREGVVLLARWAEEGMRLPTEQQLPAILNARKKLRLPGVWSATGALAAFVLCFVVAGILKIAGYNSLLGPIAAFVLVLCAVALSAVLWFAFAKGKNAALYRSVGQDLVWTL